MVGGWKTGSFSLMAFFFSVANFLAAVMCGHSCEVLKRNVSVLPGTPTEEPEKRPKDRSVTSLFSGRHMWGLKVCGKKLPMGLWF